MTNIIIRSIILLFIINIKCFADNLKIVYLDENYILKNSKVLQNSQKKINAIYAKKLAQLEKEQKIIIDKMKKTAPAQSDLLGLRMSQIQEEYQK